MIHQKKVEQIQKVLRNKSQLCVLKNSKPSNTLRGGAYKKGSLSLNLSQLNQVVSFNLEEKWVYVEPKITFEQLCHLTLQYGLIPPVVPEFKTITVGGAIMGAALESSSHHFGQVNDCALEYELILGDGEKIIASRDENRDLFFAIPGSYGTLALLTCVKLQLIQAKNWVFLQCDPYSHLNEAIGLLTQPCKQDFLEAIVYHPSHTVVVQGEMTDAQEGSLLRLNRSYSPWYVQQMCAHEKRAFRLSLIDYLFRFDRGAFWMGRYIHSLWTMVRLLFHLGVPSVKKHSIHPNLLFRLLFGWAFPSQRLYQFWHRVPKSISENLFFIHDFYTPFPQAENALRHFIEKTEIFPIWLCPIKGSEEAFLSPNYGSHSFLNIGLYGIPEKKNSIPNLTQQLEKDILTFGGRKMLYSYTYYPPDLFAKAYDERRYEALRHKYRADNAFPTLFSKVTS